MIRTPKIFLCNGARSSAKQRISDVTSLGIFSQPNNIGAQILALNDRLQHISHRVRDLVEIASYIFCADRTVYRGATDSIELASWSRRMKFVVRVSDIKFWKRRQVINRLKELLKFYNWRY